MWLEVRKCLLSVRKMFPTVDVRLSDGHIVISAQHSGERLGPVVSFCALWLLVGNPMVSEPRVRWLL